MTRGIVALLAIAAAALPASALPNGYSFRRSITVGASVVTSGPQPNFPMLVSGTFTYLKTVGNGGNVQNTTTLNAQTVPADLIFTQDLAGTLLLNWEVAFYDATSGAIEVWVQVPTLTNSAVIYEFYGKPSTTTYQGTPTLTWDSFYKAVYHFPNGTTLSAIDSTGNANNGTNTLTTAGAGQMDGAGVFNGTTSIVNMGTGTSILGIFASGGTAEAWIKPLSLGGGNNERILNKTATSDTLPSTGWIVQLADLGAGTILKLGVGFTTTTGGWTTPPASVAFNVFQHVATTYNASNTTNLPSFYINGSLMTTSASSNPAGTYNSDSGLSFVVGNIPAQSRGFNGSIDEVRLSTTMRSAGWIATEYFNQLTPSGFYTIGPQVAGGVTANVIIN